MKTLIPSYRRHDDDMHFIRDDEDCSYLTSSDLDGDEDHRSCLSSFLGKHDTRHGLALARGKALQEYRKAEERRNSSSKGSSFSHYYNDASHNRHQHQQELVHIHWFGDELAEDTDMMPSVATSSVSSGSEGGFNSDSEESTLCTSPSTRKLLIKSSSTNNAASSTPETIVAIMPLTQDPVLNNKKKNSSNDTTASSRGFSNTNGAQCKSKKATTDADDDNKNDFILTFQDFLYDWGEEVEEWRELLEWDQLGYATMDATKSCTNNIVKNKTVSKIFGCGNSKKERRSIASYISWRKKQQKQKQKQYRDKEVEVCIEQ